MIPIHRLADYYPLSEQNRSSQKTKFFGPNPLISIHRFYTPAMVQHPVQKDATSVYEQTAPPVNPVRPSALGLIHQPLTSAK
jgi:hypothetical protein